MKLAFQLYQCPPCSGRQRTLRFLLDELERRGHDCRVYSASPRHEAFTGAQWRRISVVAPGSRRREQGFLDGVQADLAADPVDHLAGFDPAPNLDVYLVSDAPAPDEAAALHGRLYCYSPAYRRRAARERAVFAPSSNTQILSSYALLLERHRELYGTPAGRTHLLPPGLGPDRQLPGDAAGRRKAVRAELGLEPLDYALLYIGNNFARGGLAQVITTLSNTREEQPSVKARLLVVGAQKPGRFRVRAKRVGVADSVEFLGPRDDIVDLMLAADLLVYPAPLAVTGTVLLEALAIGLPSVVSETCGHAHHVKAARAGILLPAPVSQKDLDRAVMRYMDGIFRADCRESARLYAGLTDLAGMYREAADYIERLGSA